MGVSFTDINNGTRCWRSMELFSELQMEGLPGVYQLIENHRWNWEM